jgi:hypothetical protein
LTTYDGPGVAEFRGFHDQECPRASDQPCEVIFSNDASLSPTFAGDIPGACEPCHEYKVTFSPQTFAYGGNHIEAVIRSGDEIIATAGRDFTEQSLFVLPESPIGIIGLMFSALAAFAVYHKFMLKK